ncbi:hypothetical protein [Paenibacillus sp. MMS20-IR301]|uniref:hypothetical protein n=1 Tax=Paenibacillus sp. MMS20-IR301 TaxID=2895946 RepID=UPI0028E3E27B|nr:hypothetical protein [Paenibacillus sp. MMS20-IR301]WNS45662.1 hypothetical protein LOS79_10440 [Paenibacillus sp. MMS20-IR301]
MRILSLLLALAVIAGCSGTGKRETEAVQPSGTAVSSEATAVPAGGQENNSVNVPAAEGLEEELPEVSPEIADKYSGFVHMDAVQLNGQVYEVYYWNKGDFAFTQFAIVKNGDIVFDSKRADISTQGGYIWSEEDELWAEALIQNNRASFLFELADNRPEAAFIVVEEIDGAMQVTVNDNVLLQYEDTDQDGEEDLVASPYFGQTPLGPALYAVYELQGTQYVPDIPRTEQYAEEQLQLKELDYKNNPSETTFESLLSAYLVLGQRSVALSRFEEFYEWAGQRAGDGGFVDEYKKLLQNSGTAGEIAGWMGKLKPLRTSK